MTICHPAGQADKHYHDVKILLSKLLQAGHDNLCLSSPMLTPLLLANASTPVLAHPQKHLEQQHLQK